MGRIPSCLLVGLSGWSLGGQLRFLGRAVHLVLAQDPPSKPDNSQRRDQKCGAQTKPGRDPFADKEIHACNYRQIGGGRIFASWGFSNRSGFSSPTPGSPPPLPSPTPT